MSGYADEALTVLKARGYRITKPRQRVVDLLAETSAALSPYEIKEKLDTAGTHVDTVSIYRILECLEENNLIHRVLTTGKVRRCDLEQEDHCHLEQVDHCHHNLVCRVCNAVQEVHCPGLQPLIAAVAAQSGFNIEQHHLEFSGVCRACS